MNKSVKMIVLAAGVLFSTSSVSHAGTVFPSAPAGMGPQLWEDHYNGFANIISNGSGGFNLESIVQLTSPHLGLGVPPSLPTPFNTNPGFPDGAPSQSNGLFTGVALTTGLQVIAIDMPSVVPGAAGTAPPGSLGYLRASNNTDIATDLALGPQNGEVFYFGAQSGVTPHLSFYNVPNLDNKLAVSNGWTSGGNSFSGTDTNGNAFTVPDANTLVAQFTFSDLTGTMAGSSPPGTILANAPTGTLAMNTLNVGTSANLDTFFVLNSDGLGVDAPLFVQNGVSATYTVNNDNGTFGTSTISGTMVANQYITPSPGGGGLAVISDPLEYVTVTPEPSSFVLLGIGGLALGLYRRRKSVRMACK